jgi:hypothetical protein
MAFLAGCDLGVDDTCAHWIATGLVTVTDAIFVADAVAGARSGRTAGLALA